MAKKATSKTRPGRGSDQFMVRFPAGMRDYIARMAEKNGRSINSEIIHGLVLHVARESGNDSVPSLSERITKALEEDQAPDPGIIKDIGNYLQLIGQTWADQRSKRGK
jgi:hypothetical protein